ncbi:MAG: cobalt-precorrin-5B (C(1))-methyltransferase CbiD [Bacteroides sp.]|nr:cobalt-precorrin-5B (C(1))-methyltransferase CbiD [Roseburia sp.]MCM1346555.1 cobalt-precorrin-5B (C(1))-methyltransferase CbiD [Bacteroides sp.]MCM1421095.1 cobalt-precorrin-5B (C(1))-methyltransferase CbiD [Bacteroides sp.]
MLLIFGGTTEGRLAAEVAEESGRCFFYSTKGELQQIALHHGKRLSGVMTKDDMVAFCRDNDICCIVDAAHPFAENLHLSIAEASLQLSIPVIRLQRSFGHKVEDAVYCAGYNDAVTRLLSHGVRRLLALSGANTIAKLKPFWQSVDTFFRILPRKESIDLAKKQGFPESNLIYYKGDMAANSLPTVEEELAVMSSVCPDAIITKESGESGGFAAKVEAARRMGIKIFVVSHPQTSIPGFCPQIVTGRHGLRRALEHLIPDFYPLHTGLTTGACATAAAKAAFYALLYGEELADVSFSLPDGEILSIPVESTLIGEHNAESVIVKDSGDDPDVTNGCRIVVRVEQCETNSGSPEFEFVGGQGVGTVTLPGLGIEVGGPAINPVPRNMIRTELSAMRDMCSCSDKYSHLRIIVSVPGGEELAKRTFNPKVGIVGGISIIGTSGIVRPFSNEAFVESIHREIEVAHASGCRHIVINSGAKSERVLKNRFPSLVPQAFIHYGNFIGETLAAIREVYGDSECRVTLGVMIGKAVKLAEGHLDTHSHKVVMNKDFLIQQAVESGCSLSAINVISEIKLARELWTILDADDSRLFFSRILSKSLEVAASVFPPEYLEIVIVSESGEIFGEFLK